MITTIFLVRHGETTDNVEFRASGPGHDSELTKKGIEQAGRLKRRLSREKINAVFSSPLGRSLKTASLAKPDGLDVIKNDGLTERNFGEIDGKKWKRLAMRHPVKIYKYWSTGSLKGVKGAEGFEAGQRRIYNTIEKIAEENEGKMILVVAHGTILRLFFAKILGLDQKASMKIRLRNCALNMVTYDNSAFKVKSINDDGFLGSE
jgi:probable phosphoglycerate mutase